MQDSEMLGGVREGDAEGAFLMMYVALFLVGLAVEWLVLALVMRVAWRNWWRPPW